MAGVGTIVRLILNLGVEAQDMVSKFRPAMNPVLGHPHRFKNIVALGLHPGFLVLALMKRGYPTIVPSFTKKPLNIS